MRHMKALNLFIICLLTLKGSTAQVIYDYKVKNPSNEMDRTMMLDIYRAKLYNDHQQEFVFVVKHFKVGNGYAWLMADLQRKDGNKISVPDDGIASACCHVEALFKKSGSKWLLVESGAFSTDVWWQGIGRKYEQAPRSIFDAAGRY